MPFMRFAHFLQIKNAFGSVTSTCTSVGSVCPSSFRHLQPVNFPEPTLCRYPWPWESAVLILSFPPCHRYQWFYWPMFKDSISAFAYLFFAVDYLQVSCFFKQHSRRNCLLSCLKGYKDKIFSDVFRYLHANKSALKIFHVRPSICPSIC